MEDRNGTDDRVETAGHEVMADREETEDRKEMVDHGRNHAEDSRTFG